MSVNDAAKRSYERLRKARYTASQILSMATAQINSATRDLIEGTQTHGELDEVLTDLEIHALGKSQEGRTNRKNDRVPRVGVQTQG